ncbi:RING-H2 finger protein ATL54 [Tripterygium wilfordii]|uniref:RING-H2 finger protein ATL54 n=2 Tax=Tripterygium wilfordii TaxID=458696 RepID=A0A7J7DTT3_TRIWF|nr:RING-H2 finger protein ATL54 [Tripterygium wilfordii]
MESVNSNDLDSREEAEEENIVSGEVGGGETSGLRIEEQNSPVEAKGLNYPSRVRSDLVENRQASTEGELQPLRRSVSMDSVSAMRIYSAVANVVPVTDNQFVASKKSKSKISSSKRRSGSFSVMKLMSGSSIGPIVMKRSFSSSGKAASSSSQGNRSLDSILPL